MMVFASPTFGCRLFQDQGGCSGCTILLHSSVSKVSHTILWLQQRHQINKDWSPRGLADSAGVMPRAHAAGTSCKVTTPAARRLVLLGVLRAPARAPQPPPETVGDGAALKLGSKTRPASLKLESSKPSFEPCFAEFEARS